MHSLYLQSLFVLLALGIVVGWILYAKNTKIRLILIIATLIVSLIWWQATFMNTYLSVNGHHFHLIVADNISSQEKGLGIRTSLPSDEGMLFVFHDSAVRCFWMKDMHFPIDIIWINADKQVVHIEHDVSPATYPTTTYCPSQAAKYVIELNAGQAQQANIKLGQQLSF